MALVPTVITPALLASVGRNAGIMEQADTDTSRFETPRLNGVLSDAGKAANTCLSEFPTLPAERLIHATRCNARSLSLNGTPPLPAGSRLPPASRRTDLAQGGHGGAEVQDLQEIEETGAAPTLPTGSRSAPACRRVGRPGRRRPGAGPGNCGGWAGAGHPAGADRRRLFSFILTRSRTGNR